MLPEVYTRIATSCASTAAARYGHGGRVNARAGGVELVVDREQRAAGPRTWTACACPASRAACRRSSASRAALELLDRQHQPRLGVAEHVRDLRHGVARVEAEPDRADLGGGEVADDEFRPRRRQQADPVAGGHADGEQRPRGAVDRVGQGPVADRPGVGAERRAVRRQRGVVVDVGGQCRQRRAGLVIGQPRLPARASSASLACPASRVNVQHQPGGRDGGRSAPAQSTVPSQTTSARDGVFRRTLVTVRRPAPTRRRAPAG